MLMLHLLSCVRLFVLYTQISSELLSLRLGHFCSACDHFFVFLSLNVMPVMDGAIARWVTANLVITCFVKSLRLSTVYHNREYNLNENIENYNIAVLRKFTKSLFLYGHGGTAVLDCWQHAVFKLGTYAGTTLAPFQSANFLRTVDDVGLTLPPYL